MITKVFFNVKLADGTNVDTFENVESCNPGIDGNCIIINTKEKQYVIPYNNILMVETTK